MNINLRTPKISEIAIAIDFQFSIPCNLSPREDKTFIFNNFNIGIKTLQLYTRCFQINVLNLKAYYIDIHEASDLSGIRLICLKECGAFELGGKHSSVKVLE